MLMRNTGKCLMNVVKTNTLIQNEEFLLTNLKKFIGKRVNIFITEVNEKPNKIRNWQFSGSVDLKGVLDDKNIRDLAYD